MRDHDGLREFARGSEAELAVALLEDLTTEEIPVAAEGGLWTYEPDRGLWRARADEELRAHIAQWDGAPVGPPNKDERQRVLRVRNSMATGAIALAMAKVHNPEHFDDAPRAVVFSNMALVATNGEVEQRDLSPELRARFGYEFALERDFQAPRLASYLESVFAGHPDAAQRIALLQEFAGACLFGVAPRYERALLLYGDGGRGKSTMVAILEGLFPGALATVAPQDFADRFRPAQLVGVRLNRCTELPSREVLRDEHFKAIVSGEAVTVERKNVQPFTFQPRCGHVFASNELPAVPGAGESYWDRWLCIEFPNRFRGQPGCIRDLGKLIVAEELPAIAAWAVDGAERLLARDAYTVPRSSERLLERWKAEADPVRAFFDQCTKPREPLDSSADWPKVSDVIADYRTWCAKTGHHPCSIQVFRQRAEAAGVQSRKRNAQRLAVKVLTQQKWALGSRRGELDDDERETAGDYGRPVSRELDRSQSGSETSAGDLGGFSKSEYPARARAHGSVSAQVSQVSHDGANGQDETASGLPLGLPQVSHDPDFGAYENPEAARLHYETHGTLP